MAFVSIKTGSRMRKRESARLGKLGCGAGRRCCKDCAAGMSAFDPGTFAAVFGAGTVDALAQNAAPGSTTAGTAAILQRIADPFAQAYSAAQQQVSVLPPVPVTTDMLSQVPTWGWAVLVLGGIGLLLAARR